MSDTKLKPCPFCGGEATLRKSEETKLYHIACFECGCRQDSSYKAESVINAWNTRKPMDNIVAELQKSADNNEAFYKANLNDIAQGRMFAYLDSIDIVKAGGVE